ncbi:MAG: NDP-hexose 4-ketoreductase, partial [Arcanobacterium sp.]|nr:NDP-hexose 4-ketoreductase [Arcanobacterium sp.]
EDTVSGYDRMKQRVNEELKSHFRPEFLNRVDDIIVFPQLNKEEILQMVDLMAAKLNKRLQDQGMALALSPAAKRLLADRGYDPVLGARPLRRAIQRDIEDVLSEKLLFGEFKSGQTIVVDVDAENIPMSFTFTGFDGDHQLPEGVAPTVDAVEAAESARVGADQG